MDYDYVIDPLVHRAAIELGLALRKSCIEFMVKETGITEPEAEEAIGKVFENVKMS